MIAELHRKISLYSLALRQFMSSEASHFRKLHVGNRAKLALHVYSYNTFWILSIIKKIRPKDLFCDKMLCLFQEFSWQLGPRRGVVPCWRTSKPRLKAMRSLRPRLLNWGPRFRSLPWPSQCQDLMISERASIWWTLTDYTLFLLFMVSFSVFFYSVSLMICHVLYFAETPDPSHLKVSNGGFISIPWCWKCYFPSNESIWVKYSFVSRSIMTSQHMIDQFGLLIQLASFWLGVERSWDSLVSVYVSNKTFNFICGLYFFSYWLSTVLVLKWPLKPGDSPLFSDDPTVWIFYVCFAIAGFSWKFPFTFMLFVAHRK